MADLFLKNFNKWLIKEWFGIETVKLGYIRDNVPELRVLEQEKITSNEIKARTLISVQTSFNQGIITRKQAETLLLELGYNETKIQELL